MYLDLAPIIALGQCANYNLPASDEHTNTHTRIHTYNLFLFPIVNFHFHHPKKNLHKECCIPSQTLSRMTPRGGQQSGHGGQT